MVQIHICMKFSHLICCSHTHLNRACLLHGVCIMCIDTSVRHLCLKWRILSHHTIGSTPTPHVCIPRLNMCNNCWNELLSGSKFTDKTIVSLVFLFSGIISMIDVLQKGYHNSSDFLVSNQQTFLLIISLTNCASSPMNLTTHN